MKIGKLFCQYYSSRWSSIIHFYSTAKDLSSLATLTPSPPTYPPPSNKVKVFVNDKEIHVEEGSVIIQACEKAGVEIPRFCYHEKLAIAGNCRICLVQVEKCQNQ